MNASPYVDTIERARAIVKLAAEGAPSSVKPWLTLDEFGSWEKSAQALLERVNEPEVLASLTKRGITTEADVNQMLANELVLAALQAALADARKNEGARGARRRALQSRRAR